MTREKAARTFVLAGQAVPAPALAAGLYLVATSIGNLRDMTIRGLETLAAADIVACEDTRVSRKLLDHYGIAAALIPYHDHNAESARPKILERLARGEAVALISDAGTPLVSDPGFKLVRAARQADHMVTAVPGASSLLAALTSSGLPTDRFFFEGFLPAKSAQRQARIAELAAVPATLVLFESGSRMADALHDLAQCLGARDAAICRELTKMHEEVICGTLDNLASESGAIETRGEFVLVVASPEARTASDADVDALLRQALSRVSVKDAVAEIALATGRARREVYQRALSIAESDDGARKP
jgi:16S rRNA (cytidine1402-2'-O)-methyltransferase